jgi:uncharacterized membrane protein YuzA (DUF378 family)
MDPSTFDVLASSFSDPLYLSKWLFKMAIVLVIIGGINLLFIGLFTTNPVKDIFGTGFARVLYILIGISAIAIMFDRDTYLPFLGPMIAPCTGLADRVPPGATRDVRVTVSPNAKVLYWASEPSTKGLEKINSWKQAYGQYENAGVATAGSDGVVILKVREPQPYAVPWKGKLDPHVHYRICSGTGFMSRVNTVYVGEQKVEGFEYGLRY